MTRKRDEGIGGGSIRVGLGAGRTGFERSRVVTRDRNYERATKALNYFDRETIESGEGNKGHYGSAGAILIALAGDIAEFFKHVSEKYMHTDIMHSSTDMLTASPRVGGVPTIGAPNTCTVPSEEDAQFLAALDKSRKRPNGSLSKNPKTPPPKSVAPIKSKTVKTHSRIDSDKLSRAIRESKREDFMDNAKTVKDAINKATGGADADGDVLIA